MNRQEWIAACAEYGVDVYNEDASFGPGRYQGESPLVVLLEAWSGEGFGDSIYSECDDPDCEERGYCECETEWLGDVFEIDDATRAEFPEFGDATFVVFCRSEQLVTLYHGSRVSVNRRVGRSTLACGPSFGKEG